MAEQNIDFSDVQGVTFDEDEVIEIQLQHGTQQTIWTKGDNQDFLLIPDDGVYQRDIIANGRFSYKKTGITTGNEYNSGVIWCVLSYGTYRWGWWPWLDTGTNPWQSYQIVSDAWIPPVEEWNAKMIEDETSFRIWPYIPKWELHQERVLPAVATEVREGEANYGYGINYEFGESLAMDGDRTVVGNSGYYPWPGPNTNTPGSIHTFEYNESDGEWVEAFDPIFGSHTPGAPGTTSNESLGRLVCMDGDYMCATQDVPNALNIYKKTTGSVSNTGWELDATFSNSSSALAMSGDFIASSNKYYDWGDWTGPLPTGHTLTQDQGAVQIYRRMPSTWAGWHPVTGMWSPSQLIRPPDAVTQIFTQPQFGHEVVMDGDWMVVGCRNGDDKYVYKKISDTWELTQTIDGRPTDPDENGRIRRLGSPDISGDYMIFGDVLGGPTGNNCNHCTGGAIHVYKNINGTWEPFQIIKQMPGDVGLGRCVAIDNGHIISGAWNFYTSLQTIGHSTLFYQLNEQETEFVYKNTMWPTDPATNSSSQSGSKIRPFGWRVGVDGNTGRSVVSHLHSYEYGVFSGGSVNFYKTIES